MDDLNKSTTYNQLWRNTHTHVSKQASKKIYK